MKGKVRVGVKGKVEGCSGGEGRRVGGGQRKTPVGHASRGLEIRVITQERHIWPPLRGKARLRGDDGG